MSQSKKKLFTVAVLFGVLALSSLACGGTTKEEFLASGPTPAPMSEKSLMMQAAHECGEVVFVYNKVEEGVALCVGSMKVARLKEVGYVYRMKLTGNEALNLSLGKINPETANCTAFQDISGVGSGDYLSWDASGTLSWTRYVAQ